MKNRILSIFCFVIIITFLSGCSTDPNEKANELYVEASQVMHNVTVEAKSYSEAIILYHKARGLINEISKRYPSSNLAVSLMSGQTEISGLTRSEFEGIEALLNHLIEAEKNPLSCALLVAEASDDSEDKAKALSEIAVKFAEVGQKEKATQILSQALESAKTMKGVSRNSALSDVARNYAEAGQFTQALETTITIENKWSKASVLSDIAGKYAEAGQNEKATQILSAAFSWAKIVGSETRDFALSDVAVQYAETGQFTQALETAKTIENKRTKATVLSHIASKYAETGQFTQALETAKTIERAPNKAYALSFIAGSYIKNGQKAKVAQILSQALETAKAINDADDTARVLTNIAGSYIKNEQKEKATQILSQALETTKAIKDADNTARILADIAGKYAEAGQKEKAAQILSQALETAKAIKDDEYSTKAWTLNHITVQYAEVGQFTQALEMAKTYKGIWRNRVLSNVAGIFAKVGELTLALETAKTIEDLCYKALLLSEIAGKYAETGQQPNENDIKYLRDIVHAVKPIKTTLSWE